jgi:hypothetical protein
MHGALWRHWGTPPAIYGTVAYASLIAATSFHTGAEQSAAQVLLFCVATVVAFWVAHVFAATLAFHGDSERPAARLRDSVRHALFDTSGMLEAAVLPTVPLVLAALGMLEPDAAVNAALWVAVGMLALLGYLAFAVRHTRVWVRVAGGAATGVLGLIVVGLETLLH